jgi:hypothetical protein
VTDKREECGCTGPELKCVACGYEALSGDLFERHEMSPDIWRWFCLTCVQACGLYEGK